MFGFGMSPAGCDQTDAARAFGPLSGPEARLSDAEIRAALAVHGGPGNLAPSGLLLEEVECWRGYVRADYICLSEETLSVIEVKSDYDSLRRFPEQARVYSAIADRVTLVVGWTLAAAALRAAPWWWDVVLAERDSASGVRFVQLRDGVQNPGVSPAALAAMLPMDEIRRLARSARLRSTGVPGQSLRALVAAQVRHLDLRAAVTRWLSDLAQRRAATAQ